MKTYPLLPFQGCKCRPKTEPRDSPFSYKLLNSENNLTEDEPPSEFERKHEQTECARRALKTQRILPTRERLRKEEKHRENIRIAKSLSDYRRKEATGHSPPLSCRSSASAAQLSELTKRTSADRHCVEDDSTAMSIHTYQRVNLACHQLPARRLSSAPG